jgi:hypothetical protein
LWRAAGTADPRARRVVQGQWLVRGPLQQCEAEAIIRRIEERWWLVLFKFRRGLLGLGEQRICPREHTGIEFGVGCPCLIDEFRKEIESAEEVAG